MYTDIIGFFFGDSYPNYLDVINKPNKRGMACDYQPIVYTFPPTTNASMGLPNFVVGDLFEDEVRLYSDKKVICIGDSIQFTDGSRYNPLSWYWEFGDGTFSTERNPMHIYTDTGTYTVKLYTAFRCKTDSLIKQNYIQVKTCLPPQANFEASTLEGCTPFEANFSFKGFNATGYEWDLDNHGIIDTSGLTEVNYTYTDSGYFSPKLIVTNEYGKDTLIKPNYIHAKQCNSSLQAPNIFTPNGDNINDKWEIKHQWLESFEVKVYNRWGRQVFATNNPDNYWAGLGFVDGVYYFYIKAEGADGKVYNIKGTITIMR